MLKLGLRLGLPILASVSGSCTQSLDIGCQIYNSSLLTLQSFNHFIHGSHPGARSTGLLVFFGTATSFLSGVYEGNFQCVLMKFYHLKRRRRKNYVPVAVLNQNQSFNCKLCDCVCMLRIGFVSNGFYGDFHCSYKVNRRRATSLQPQKEKELLFVST